MHCITTICAETGLRACAGASRCSAYLPLRVPKLPCLPHSGHLDGRHVPLLIVQRVIGRGTGCIRRYGEVRFAHSDLCMSCIAADISEVTRAHHGRHVPFGQPSCHMPAARIQRSHHPFNHLVGLGELHLRRHTMLETWPSSLCQQQENHLAAAFRHAKDVAMKLEDIHKL